MNAVGDVIDPSTNQVLAGTRSPKIGKKLYNKDLFVDSLELMKTSVGRTVFSIASKSNTVIGVIVTNANLSKLQMTKIAQMGQMDWHAAFARPIQCKTRYIICALDWKEKS